MTNYAIIDIETDTICGGVNLILTREEFDKFRKMLDDVLEESE